MPSIPEWDLDGAQSKYNLMIYRMEMAFAELIYCIIKTGSRMLWLGACPTHVSHVTCKAHGMEYATRRTWPYCKCSAGLALPMDMYE